MSHEQIIVQAGDFQGEGTFGNLAKISGVAAYTLDLKKQGKNVSFHCVGDWYDAHTNTRQDGLSNILAKYAEQEAIQNNPELLDAMNELESHQKALALKYKDSPNKDLSEQDFLDMSAAKFRLEKHPALQRLQHITEYDAPTLFYRLINDNILNKLKDEGVDIYSVLGNNDPITARDDLSNVIHLDTLGPQQDGAIQVIGANNTNYPQDLAYREFAFPADDAPNLEDSLAYQRLHGKGDPSKPTVLVLHGPADGYDLRNGHETGCKGITALIEEYNPDMIECGHMDRNAILKEVNGVLLARSSKLVSFAHYYRDGKRYKSDVLKLVV